MFNNQLGNNENRGVNQSGGKSKLIPIIGVEDTPLHMPDSGEFNAEVVSTKLLMNRSKTWKDPQTKTYKIQNDVEVCFKIGDSVVKKTCQAVIKPNNHLGKLVKGILGSLPAGDNVDLDSLVGKKCKVTIVTKEYASRNGRYAIITGVSPADDNETTRNSGAGDNGETE